jgi:hypothetical protein
VAVAERATRAEAEEGPMKRCSSARQSGCGLEGQRTRTFLSCDTSPLLSRCRNRVEASSFPVAAAV